jgi:hypothetical protein
MTKVYLVGFDFKGMEVFAKKIGGYFEKGIYSDRVKAIVTDNEKDAVIKFHESLKNWMRDDEKKWVKILDVIDEDTWRNEYYRSEYAWMRKIGEM